MYVKSWEVDSMKNKLEIVSYFGLTENWSQTLPISKLPPCETWHLWDSRYIVPWKQKGTKHKPAQIKSSVFSKDANSFQQRELGAHIAHKSNTDERLRYIRNLFMGEKLGDTRFDKGF